MSECSYRTGFQNVDKINQYLLNTQIEENYKEFLNWGFLNIGGFTNVSRPLSNINNLVQFHKLKHKQDPAYTDGQIWETFRKNWVYETGVMYDVTSPNNISGVYIDGYFAPAPTGDSTYGYSLNYDLGRVTFNTAISKTSDVQMDYSCKNVQILKSSECYREFKRLQQLSFQSADPDPSITSNHKIQPPAIIVEPIETSSFTGYELGSLKYKVSQDILLHIFTENYSERNNIIDIIRLQKEKFVRLYNINLVLQNKVYSLDRNGSININRIQYNNLCQEEAYFWKPAYILEVSVINYDNLGSSLFYSSVRLTTEVIV